MLQRQRHSALHLTSPVLLKAVVCLVSSMTVNRELLTHPPLLRVHLRCQPRLERQQASGCCDSSALAACENLVLTALAAYENLVLRALAACREVLTERRALATQILPMVGPMLAGTQLVGCYMMGGLTSICCIVYIDLYTPEFIYIYIYIPSTTMYIAS